MACANVVRKMYDRIGYQARHDIVDFLLQSLQRREPYVFTKAGIRAPIFMLDL